MSDLKKLPTIGEHYFGEHYDRPAIRQMPRHWVLEETRQKRKDLSLWAKIVLTVWLVLALVQLVKGLS